jgi:hypothetical protein
MQSAVGGPIIFLERGSASNLFRHTGCGRKNRCRALFMQLLKELEEIKHREP